MYLFSKTKRLFFHIGFAIMKNRNGLEQQTMIHIMSLGLLLDQAVNISLLVVVKAVFYIGFSFGSHLDWHMVDFPNLDYGYDLKFFVFFSKFVSKSQYSILALLYYYTYLNNGFWLRKYTCKHRKNFFSLWSEETKLKDLRKSSQNWSVKGIESTLIINRMWKKKLGFFYIREVLGVTIGARS